MPRFLNYPSKQILGCGLALAMLVPLDGASASGFRWLDFFNVSNGGSPGAGLTGKDASGNRYGTTSIGGANYAGVVYQLASDGTLTVLHSFANDTTDGGYPFAGLLLDKAGDLYGTAPAGGPGGAGIVFRLAPDGTETVLHAFTGAPTDGANSYATLIKDKAGNLYGTTKFGGVYDYGTVFKLAPDGTETVLHNFPDHGGVNDGVRPCSGLIKDNEGNLYGTTNSGGTYGNGVVFKLAPDGTETVFHAFTGGTDGAAPFAGLIKDRAGNFYGTTSAGGAAGDCSGSGGCGVVFKLAADGTETVLHSFTGGAADGYYPYAGVTMDTAGNLYGTTLLGGSHGGGIVYRVAPGGTETVLYTFKGGTDGSNPYAGVTTNKTGTLLFGTTASGAAGYGTIFRIRQ